jgi:predicted nucleotidyltransferase
MRLPKTSIGLIKKEVQNHDPKAIIYLFGSRTDDSKKGGDIDLLILSQKITLEKVIEIKLSLYDALGEQKIDIILAQETEKPFVKIAMREGIVL